MFYEAVPSNGSKKHCVELTEPPTTNVQEPALCGVKGGKEGMEVVWKQKPVEYHRTDDKLKGYCRECFSLWESKQ